MWEYSQCRNIGKCIIIEKNAEEITVIAIIDYSPLWETMKARRVTQYQLLKAGVDNKTLDSLKKGKNITMLTLEKLCKVVDCTPDQVVRFL